MAITQQSKRAAKKGAVKESRGAADSASPEERGSTTPLTPQCEINACADPQEYGTGYGPIPERNFLSPFLSSGVYDMPRG